jgi:hypothetical protein
MGVRLQPPFVVSGLWVFDTRGIVCTCSTSKMAIAVASALERGAPLVPTPEQQAANQAAIDFIADHGS